MFTKTSIITYVVETLYEHSRGTDWIAITVPFEDFELAAKHLKDRREVNSKKILENEVFNEKSRHRLSLYRLVKIETSKEIIDL